MARRHAGGCRRCASTLNLITAEIRANLAAVAPGVDGHLLLHNQNGSIHLIADLAGYFIAAPPAGSPA